MRSVQTFGSPTDILIRLGQDHDSLSWVIKFLSALQAGETQQLNLRRNEFVGAQVGEELREQGGWACCLSIVHDHGLRSVPFPD